MKRALPFVLLLIVFLAVNSQVNSMMRPFITRQLNDTEDLSIMA